MNKKRSLFHRNSWPRASRRPLQAERLERRDLLASVFETGPLPNSFDAAVTSDVTATFNDDISSPSATLDNIAIHTSRGRLGAADGTVTTAADVVTVDPVQNFFAGELVQVTVTAGLEDTNSGPVAPYVWQFRTKVSSGTGLFADGGEIPGNSTRAVSLGDVDNDGDIDAFVVYEGNSSRKPGKWNPSNRLWVNDGAGNFSKSGQDLGIDNSIGVKLGDLDGDGDLDAFVANDQDGHRVWFNDGHGQFDDPRGQILGDHAASSIDLGDFDGDGDLDALVADGNAPRVWINDGAGTFQNDGAIGLVGGKATLGDVDADGDLDIFFAIGSGPNQVWLNNGEGLFQDSGQRLEGYHATDVELGDFDGDGDLDAFEVNVNSEGHIVWLNQGGKQDGTLGEFVDSGQRLGENFGERSQRAAVGDVDFDGDLDVFVTSWSFGDRVWINDGTGGFDDSGQSLGDFESQHLELADLDGDGDLDAVVALTRGPEFRVWFNENGVPPSGQSIHVGDLDGTASTGRGGKWNAEIEITIHDGNEAPVVGAAVTGVLTANNSDAGSLSCTTGTAGQCVVTKNNIRNSDAITLTITTVDFSGATYDPVASHDPDGGSGTTITVQKPSSTASSYTTFFDPSPNSEDDPVPPTSSAAQVHGTSNTPGDELFDFYSLKPEALAAVFSEIGSSDDDFVNRDDLLATIDELLPIHHLFHIE